MNFKYGYEWQSIERYKQDFLPYNEEIYYSRVHAARSVKHQGWIASYAQNLQTAGWYGTSGGMGDARTSLQYASDIRAANGGALPNTYTSIIDPIYGDEIAWEPWNWQDEVFKNGFAQNYNLDFSGGNEKGTYYLALNYYNNEGVAVGTSYDRISITANSDYKIFDNLKIGTNINYSFLDEGMGGYDNDGYSWYERSSRLPSTVRYQDSETGEYVPGNSGKPNPSYWLEVNDIGSYKSKTTVSTFLEWDIVPGLTFRPFASLYKIENSYGRFQKKSAYNGNRTSNGYNREEMNTQFDATLSYLKTFNDVHHINVLAGTSFINKYNYYVGGSTYGAGTDLIPTMNAGSDENDDITSTLDKSAVQSWFGRINYNFDDKYLLSASLRHDGASNFSENYHWGNFPGASVGWNVHNEDFWKIDQISLLKLRASYGSTGNNKHLSIFDTRGRYSTVQYAGNTGLLNTTLANDNLKWEITTSYDVGFDMGLFNNRISLLFDYYYKNSDDRLYDTSLASFTGFNSIKTNFGSFINKGVELGLDATLIKKENFKWDLSFNWSYNNGKVDKLPETTKDKNRDGGFEVWDASSQSYRFVGGYAEGERPDGLFGFSNDGVFATQAEADAFHVLDTYNKAGFQYKQAGDTKWGDLDGNGLIDSRDQTLFGYKLPDQRGGMTNTLNYKGFHFTFVVDWALGHTIWNYAELRIYADSQGEDRLSENTQYGWMYEGDNTKYPRIARGEQNGPGNTQRPSGQNGMYFLKGDYLAFRELSLSYSLPQYMVSKLPLSNISFNISGRNLGWIKDKDLRNPEAIDGEDRYMYPVPLIISSGINLTF